jgi:hypothetical protein
MKKQLLSLFALAAITTTSWADITTSQVKDYMSASGTDSMLEMLQTQIGTGLQQKASMSGSKIPDEILTDMTNIMSSKKNIALFTSDLINLEEDDYKEIMSFYKSAIGKKVADQTKHIDMAKMQKELPEFMKKKISPQREELIEKLMEASLSEEMQEEMMETTMEITIDAMPVEMQDKFRIEMDKQLSEMQPMLKEQLKQTSAYTYKDYSDKEIKELIEHYKLPSAKAELQSIINGSSKYMKVVMTRVIDFLIAQKK